MSEDQETDEPGPTDPEVDGQGTPERALSLLRAMGHPTRSAILRVLGTGIPMRVSDVAEDLGLPPNLISYHVRQLAKVGIVHKVPPVGPKDRRETWWAYDRTVSLQANLDSIRALPGADVALAAFEDLEAQRTMELFSLSRLEAAQEFEWPIVHGSGFADLTYEQAKDVTSSFWEVFEHALETSRENSRKGVPRKAASGSSETDLTKVPEAGRTEPDHMEADRVEPGSAEPCSVEPGSVEPGSVEEVRRYEFRVAFLPVIED